MTQPALFVANYIIEYSNEKGYEVNNLKLQKILYFINARNLVERGAPIFNESMQKWKYGPVVSEVYHEYKKYGAFSISNDDIIKEKIDFVFDQSDDDFPDIYIEQYDSTQIKQHDKSVIESTVDKLNKFGAFELVDITHKHPMWQIDEDRIMAGEKNILYDNNEIREYFKSHKESQLWKN